MYRTIILLLSALIYNLGAAQEKKGIDFRNDHTAAFEIAKKEDKLVFMYFYVPNCNTCDWLAKDFDNRSLGKLYNDHYLSYSLDAAGTGKKVAEYFGVFSFPTLLFITPDGDVKLGVRGYRDGKAIFESGILALESNKDIKKTMDAKYKANPNDTDHLYDYIEYQFIRKKYSKGKKLIKEYLKQRDSIDKGSWMNLVLDYANDTESYAYEILLLEKENFIKEFGEKLINTTIWNSMIGKLSQRNNPSNFTSFEKKFIKDAVKEGYDPQDDGLNIFYSEYLFSNTIANQLRLSSSDKSLFTKYALSSILVEDHTFERMHLITMGVHLISYYQEDNAMTRLYDVLYSNFKKDPHHSYLDLQSVTLYVLEEEEAAVEKIVAANELAIKSGEKNFKPSITEFKRLGIVK